ncbi:hypothetical protein [Microvirga sp. P5_D2]
MKEPGVIDLPNGRRGSAVYASSDAGMIISEVGPESIDYIIVENGLR